MTSEGSSSGAEYHAELPTGVNQTLPPAIVNSLGARPSNSRYSVTLKDPGSITAIESSSGSATYNAPPSSSIVSPRVSSAMSATGEPSNPKTCTTARDQSVVYTTERSGSTRENAALSMSTGL